MSTADIINNGQLAPEQSDWINHYRPEEKHAHLIWGMKSPFKNKHDSHL